jgi:hypothetical protein
MVIDQDLVWRPGRADAFVVWRTRLGRLVAKLLQGAQRRV